MYGRAALVLALSALLVVSAVAPVGATTSSTGVEGTATTQEPVLEGEPHSQNETVGPQEHPTTKEVGPSADPEKRPGTTDATNDRTEAGTQVAEGLETATGETQVIVRFEDPDPRTLERSEDVVGTLKERSAASDRALEAFATRHEGVEVERSFWITNAALVTVDADRTDPQELTTIDGVTKVHPNYEGTYESVARGAPVQDGTESHADPDYGNTTSNGYAVTYGLDMVGAPEYWDRYDTRGANATVAVVDSGIDTDHPDLNLTENGWAEFDDEGNRINSSPHDPIYSTHGTHVSGTVAGGNASGTHIGVAPEAELMVAGSGYNLSVASAYASFEWAIEHENDVDVLSASLGFGEGVDTLQQPIRNARMSGIVFVGSAGNSGPGVVTTPGDSYDGINVGAVDDDARVADFSSSATIDADQYWDQVPDDWPEQYTVPTVTAPGVNVCSAVGGGGYDCTYDGTSMAAPHVAGAAALLRSANPNMSVQEIRLRLSRTAATPANLTESPEVRYGHGIVNVTRARSTTFASVSGTVRTNGTVAEGVFVTADSGQITRTSADGTYELTLEGGNRTLVFDAFGYEPVERTIDLEGDVVEDVNLTQREPAIERVVGLPRGSDPGETLNATYRIGGATNVTIEPADGFSSPDNTTLTVAGDSTATYGEPVAIDPDVGTVTIEITTDANYTGSIEVDVVASGENESVTATGGPTLVFDDVVRYPSEVPAGIDLGDTVDGVGANATVIVEEGTHAVEPAEDNVGNATMVVEANTTVRAADGASPVVEIDNASDGEYGIVLQGQRSELRGIAVDGGGSANVVTTTGTNVSVRNLTLENGSVGIRVSSGAPETLSDNLVRNVSAGIYTASNDRMGTIRDNRVVDASLYGILLQSGFDELRGNSIASDRASSRGIFLATYGGMGPVSNNSVRLTGEDSIGVDMWITGERAHVANNTIEADTGVRVDEYSLLTLEHNEIEDVRRGVQIEGWASNTGSAEHVIANNTVRNASERSIAVEDFVGPTLSNNDLDGARVELVNAADVAVRNTTVANASVGITLRGQPGSYYSDQRTRNVTVEGTTTSNVTGSPVAIRGGSDAVTVDHPNATIVLQGTSWNDDLAVRNVTLANGATVSANGSNATLSAATAPNGTPANRSQVGAGLAVERNGSNPWVDVTQDLDATNLNHVYKGTMAFYGLDDGNWSVVGDNHVNDTRVVAENVTRTGTIAVYGEASGTLEGTVVNASGAPVANATIALERDGTRLGTITANETGEFSGIAPVSATHAVATRKAFTENRTAIDVPENGTETASFTIERKSVYVAVDDFSEPWDPEQYYPYTVSASVSNLGTQPTTTTVEYLFNGSVVANETVSLDPGATRTVEFEHTSDEYGDFPHRIRTVNESTPTRMLDVDYSYTEPDDGDDSGGSGGGSGYSLPPATEPSPSFSLTSIDLGADEVAVGETVTVDVRVDNDGDANGEYTATLTADGRTLDSETVSVNSNWYETLTLSTSFDEPGTYNLVVDGESAGIVRVTGESDVEVTDASVDQSEVSVGETVAVTATVENAGSVDGTKELTLLVDGEPATTTEVSVPAGETRTVTFEHTLEESGTAALTVEGIAAGTVTVDAESDDSGGSGGMPGFGPIVAVVGLLAGALLARRAKH